MLHVSNFDQTAKGKKMDAKFDLSGPETINQETRQHSDIALSRRTLGGLSLGALFFSGYALSPDKVLAQAITTDEVGLFTKNIVISPLVPEGDYQIPAYIAFPDDRKKHKVILVVSEVFGVHDYIRDICRRLAKQGYCAIAPDFFARKGNAAEAKSFDEVKLLVEAAGLEQVMGDIGSVFAWLKTKPDLGQFKKKPFAHLNRYAITGYCWGGAVVWMAASRFKEIKTGVAWYGRLVRPPKDQFLGAEERQWPVDIADKIKVPVLGLYGGKDQGIPVSTVDEMRALLKKGTSKSDIIVYPDAPHAFHADYRKTYIKETAEDGWARLLAWFKAYI